MLCLGLAIVLGVVLSNKSENQQTITNYSLILFGLWFFPTIAFVICLVKTILIKKKVNVNRPSDLEDLKKISTRKPVTLLQKLLEK